MKPCCKEKPVFELTGKEKICDKRDILCVFCVQTHTQMNVLVQFCVHSHFVVRY